jgi:hypothetical protein
MTTTDMTAAEVNDSMRNGVDTATLFATLDAVNRPRSCARSWRSRELARRSTTSSPTGCPSPSRWTLADAQASCHDPRRPGFRRSPVPWPARRRSGHPAS